MPLTTYLSKNSDKKLYPWQLRKSSKRVWVTSDESFKRQNTVANISTISKGCKSLAAFCMFSTQREIQPLSVRNCNRFKIKSLSWKAWIIICNVLWMYPNTRGVNPCLVKTTKTSFAFFLHSRLCCGHQELNAENNSVKSSFLASSSVAAGTLHNLTRS